MRSGRSDRGATLIETVVAIGVALTVCGVAVPLMTTARDEQRVDSAARYLVSRIRLARARAAQRGAAVGLRFTTDGDGVLIRSFIDENGNGVRTADIERGLDRPLDPGLRLRDRFDGVRFAISPAAPLIGASAPAGPGADPIRIGSGGILTVTPLGTASSGTVYLRSRDGHQAAVRVLGATARAQMYRFHHATGRWRSR